MIYTAIVLFILAAIFGITILIKWLTNKNASRSVVYSHGIVAVAALIVLIVFAIQNPEHFPKASLILFSIGALGGFYMFVLDLKKKESPMSIAFIHALLAVGGLTMLLIFAFM
jgi:hypothetical protein